MNGDYDDFYYLERGSRLPMSLQSSEQENYIRLIKRRLKSQNYFKGRIDGNFDEQVRNAIMELQNDHGLALTGILDDKVLEILFKPDTEHMSVLKEEYTSDDVLILEVKLKKAGLKPEIIKDDFGISKVPQKEITKFKDLKEKMFSNIIGDLNLPFPIYEGEIYVARKGDTLWSISKRFGTTVEELMRVNNLNTTLLSVGQQLIVPVNNMSEPFSNIYTVKTGDSLWAIARRFNTSIEALVMVNNLTSDELNIGDQLIIPSDEMITKTKIYVVKRGDNLWEIANTFGTTVDKIKMINGLTSNLINVGQELKIPR